MKHILFCLVLAVLVSFAVAGAILQPDPASKSDLTSGGISVGDKLLSRHYYTKSPKKYYYQFTFVFFHTTGRITAIHATEVGLTQFANATIIEGGVGHHNVTIRLETAVSRGFHYLIDIWGRYD